MDGTERDQQEKDESMERMIDRGPMYHQPIPMVSDYRESVSDYIANQLRQQQLDEASKVFPALYEPTTERLTFRQPRSATTPIDATAMLVYKSRYEPVTYVSPRSYAILAETEYGQSIIEELRIRPTTPAPSSRVVVQQRERGER